MKKKVLLTCLLVSMVPGLNGQTAYSPKTESFEVNSAPPRRLSYLGRIICHHMDTHLDSFLFVNYWFGGGDIELTDSQFDSIIVCFNQQGLYTISDTLSTDSTIIPYVISFYDTPYAKSFGYATVYVNPERRVVGFLDHYNFDRKRWGIRPLKHEFYVRILSLLSPASAAPFDIRYGHTP